MGEDQEGHPKISTGDYFHFTRVQVLSGQGVAGSALIPPLCVLVSLGHEPLPAGLSLEADLHFSSLSC